MATVTGLTAARMQEIIDATIVGAHITGDDLILELYDTTEINAGYVRGPQGSIGPAAEPGDVKESIQTTNHGNWLIFGATHLGVDVAHPNLWALVPTSWKVGSDLVLPSMADTIVQGDGVSTNIGDITGSNTIVLSSINLPPHVHTGPSHFHTQPAHTHTITHTHGMSHTHEHVHTHTISHDHASFNTASGGGHTHSVHYLNAPAPGSGTFSELVSWTETFSGATNINSLNDGAHIHAIDVPLFSGNSGGASDATTGASSISSTGASSSANTGSSGGDNTGYSGTADTGNGPGTSTPISIEQKAMRLNYFLYGT